MVYDGLWFWWFLGLLLFLTNIPTTAVPGKYQWGCLPLSKRKMRTQYHPVTTLSLYYPPPLTGPQALIWNLLPPPHSPPLKPVQNTIRPAIQTVQMWNLLGEGFSKYSYKVASLVPRWLHSVTPCTEYRHLHIRHSTRSVFNYENKGGLPNIAVTAHGKNTWILDTK